MTRTLIAAFLSLALCGAGPKPQQLHIASIGIITALGDTCMFERVPDKPFEWIAPPEASFLEVSDWGIDDHVANTIASLLGRRYRVQSIPIEHQDFDTWTYRSLARRIRELPVPLTPVDAYLVVLRDWRVDEIGDSDHQVAGLGLYRRDRGARKTRFGVFASYRLVLADPDTGDVIASRPALLPDGRLPWLPATPGLWPPTQNDLTQAQRRALQSDFLELIHATLPRTLRQLRLAD
ncbi:MAG TPA: hypothetical protein VIY09_06250 [Rhizomicrobium sp.]